MTDQSGSIRGAASDRLMTIGVFARRSRLSLRALRLYDEQGLLVPDRVDPSTGHRWYRESQLFTARLIVLLRQIDMPLSRVAELIAAPGEQGAELLTAYWDQIERRMAGQRRLVELLRTSLAGGEERFGEYAVAEREVDELVVLAERRHLHTVDLEDWLRRTKQRLLEIAELYGGPTAGLLVIFHGEVSRDSDGPVEVCVPVDPEFIPATLGSDFDIDVRVEPAHREAYVTVTKAQFEAPQILSVYDEVRRWSETNGHLVVGPGREVLHPGIDPHAASLTDPVCDVAYPIR